MIQGIAGSSGVRTFAGENTVAIASFLNQPMDCSFGSAGSLYVCDTKNQRIRRIDGLNTPCHYRIPENQIADVSESYIHNYAAKTGAANKACSSKELVSVKSTKTVADYYATAQVQISKGKMEEYELKFCKFDAKGTQALVEANFTNNLYVMCDICKEFDEKPFVCPSTAFCECRAAVQQLLFDPVYLGCPLGDATYDPWHKWISGYSRCFWNEPSGDLDYLNAGGAIRAQMKSYLKVLPTA